MSMEYDSVGGIGVYVNEELLESLGYYKDNEDGKSNDIDDFLSELCTDRMNNSADYYECGNSWTGNTKYVLLVRGDIYKELKSNIPLFIESIYKLGYKIKEDDLRVISDYHIF